MWGYKPYTYSTIYTIILLYDEERCPVRGHGFFKLCAKQLCQFIRKQAHTRCEVWRCSQGCNFLFSLQGTVTDCTVFDCVQCSTLPLLSLLSLLSILLQRLKLHTNAKSFQRHNRISKVMTLSGLKQIYLQPPSVSESRAHILCTPQAVPVCLCMCAVIKHPKTPIPTFCVAQRSDAGQQVQRGLPRWWHCGRIWKGFWEEVWDGVWGGIWHCDGTAKLRPFRHLLVGNRSGEFGGD